jgi:hypothetical protein
MRQKLTVLHYPKGPNHFGDIAYVALGTKIYFCGLSSPNEVISTINGAENIVLVIAAKEGRPWRELQFYDVQTHKGYFKPKGSYEIDQLIFRDEPGRPHVEDWLPVDLSDDLIAQRRSGIKDRSELEGVPAEVLDLFREHIG